ncbi:hypothetical protein ACIF83_40055 [Streptomyces sp. NPDC085866]|uniref:hypothetical protein n=1 Tax=Streptomyces sp. NPDC085866 TaxID=3365736 RepID=UPI0037D60AA2
MMIGAGSGDRPALGVLTQYPTATTDQMHRVIAAEVRIEQTRRRACADHFLGSAPLPAQNQRCIGRVLECGLGQGAEHSLTPARRRRVPLPG